MFRRHMHQILKLRERWSPLLAQRRAAIKRPVPGFALFIVATVVAPKASSSGT